MSPRPFARRLAGLLVLGLVGCPSSDPPLDAAPVDAAIDAADAAPIDAVDAIPIDAVDAIPIDAVDAIPIDASPDA